MTSYDVTVLHNVPCDLLIILRQNMPRCKNLYKNHISAIKEKHFMNTKQKNIILKHEDIISLQLNLLCESIRLAFIVYELPVLNLNARSSPN